MPNQRRAFVRAAWQRFVERTMKLLDLLWSAGAVQRMAESLVAHYPTLSLHATEMLRPEPEVVMTESYTVDPYRCLHPAAAAKKFGNGYGRFKECQQCGVVWKGQTYVVPRSVEEKQIFETIHGWRQQQSAKLKPLPAQGQVPSRGAKSLARSAKSSGYSSQPTPHCNNTTFRRPAAKTSQKPAETTSATSTQHHRLDRQDSSEELVDQEDVDILSTPSESD